MDVMIDLETLGTTNDCIVLSIGAVKFDKNGIKDKLYFVLDIKEQFERGRIVNPDTLVWWINNTKESQQVFNESKVSVQTALSKLAEFIGYNGCFVWGNGSIFDISILEHMYRQYCINIPWAFYNVMDLRTLMRFNCESRFINGRKGVYHNALDDAITQANVVIDAMNRISTTK